MCTTRAGTVGGTSTLYTAMRGLLHAGIFSARVCGRRPTLAEPIFWGCKFCTVVGKKEDLFLVLRRVWAGGVSRFCGNGPFVVGFARTLPQRDNTHGKLQCIAILRGNGAFSRHVCEN